MLGLSLRCPECNTEMKEYWCDDDVHEPGFLYECECVRAI